MRNESRLNPTIEELSNLNSNTPATTTSNFNFVTPTEMVSLPSQGKFYSEDHPLHNKDAIEIKHMTAKEEDILLNQGYLNRGVAVDKLLESVITDKSIKLNDLLIGDKNAIVIAARVTGYGPTYIAKTTCPNCFEVEEKEFNLEEIASRPVQVSDAIEVTDAGSFKVTLPRSKREVEGRFFDGHDEKVIGDISQKRKKHKLPENQLISMLSRMIISIDGTSERSVVDAFVESMPAFDSRYLRKTYENIMPNINTTFGFECDSCSYEGEVQMPLTAEFFWDNR